MKASRRREKGQRRLEPRGGPPPRTRTTGWPGWKWSETTSCIECITFDHRPSASREWICRRFSYRTFVAVQKACTFDCERTGGQLCNWSLHFVSVLIGAWCVHERMFPLHVRQHLSVQLSSLICNYSWSIRAKLLRQVLFRNAQLKTMFLY